jgi:hypothetical protein
VEYTKNDLLSQWNIDHKLWGALGIIVRAMYLIDCLFDKSVRLFVDLPVLKSTFSGIQTNLSFMPQISFANSSNSLSVMPACAFRVDVFVPYLDTLIT